jgi:riboflavin biosynthesis pyrimidine reductase
LHKLIL